MEETLVGKLLAAPAEATDESDASGAAVTATLKMPQICTMARKETARVSFERESFRWRVITVLVILSRTVSVHTVIVVVDICVALTKAAEVGGATVGAFNVIYASCLHAVSSG